MTQTPRPQSGKSEEKHKEDRGHFLQIPYYVIDSLDMTDNAKMGFIRFCRLFNRKDKTIEFRGYYRGLARALDKSPAHTISIVDQWVAFNLVQREDIAGGVILRVNTSAMWERNKIHKEAQNCSNYEQQRLYDESSTVHEINTTVQNINTAIHRINTAIQNMNSDEREKAATRLLDIARLLDFFSAPESEQEQSAQTSTEEKKADDPHSQEGTEQLSYSQDTSTIRENGDENETHSQFGGCMARLIAEFEANLASYETQLFVVPSDTWLQENTETHADTQPPSQEKPVQTNIFGEALPEKPTAPASSCPPILVGTKPDVPEIRQKTATQITKERKEIERHVWKLLDDAAGAKIGRAFTKPMEDLVTGVMDGAYVDEDFTFSVQDLKARGQSLTFSNIVNNMADAVNKRKAGQQPGKIIQFQQNNQPHKGSPTGFVMTSQQEQELKERNDRNFEERKALVAARAAKQSALA